jgi:hypothetical protein
MGDLISFPSLAYSNTNFDMEHVVLTEFHVAQPVHERENDGRETCHAECGSAEI